MRKQKSREENKEWGKRTRKKEKKEKKKKKSIDITIFIIYHDQKPSPIAFNYQYSF